MGLPLGEPIFFMLHRYFDHTSVLSQSYRNERIELFEKEAEKNLLDYAWHWTTYHENPHISFNLSQYCMIETAYNKGANTFLGLEDDVVFQNMQIVGNVISKAPDNWHILYFGCNARPFDGFPTPRKANEHWVRVNAAYTTHCIAYRREVMAKILKTYDPLKDNIYDAWLSETILPSFNAYCCVPFLAVQRTSFSFLWNRIADYSDIFKTSEEYLKSI